MTIRIAVIMTSNNDTVLSPWFDSLPSTASESSSRGKFNEASAGDVKSRIVPIPKRKQVEKEQNPGSTSPSMNTSRILAAFETQKPLMRDVDIEEESVYVLENNPEVVLNNLANKRP